VPAAKGTLDRTVLTLEDNIKIALKEIGSRMRTDIAWFRPGEIA
jgi:hypothetical protein